MDQSPSDVDLPKINIYQCLEQENSQQRPSTDGNFSESDSYQHSESSTTAGHKPQPKKTRKKSLADMDYEHMSALRQGFLDRWKGQDLGLTKAEFQAVLKKTLNMTIDMEKVDRIYMQVDLRETGLMRWCDYITSVSQTAQLRAYMTARGIKPLFGEKMTFIKTRHRDEIVRIRFIPRISLHYTKINYNSGRYLMLGRTGHVTMWTLNLSLISSHYIGATEGLHSLYFVDMVVLYPSTMIAVTSTDRKIILYEVGSRGMQEKYSIVTLGNCITCMDFWSDLRSRTYSLLVWGDTAGDIHALELNVNRLGGVFDTDKNHEIISRVLYADLLKHKIHTVRLHRIAGMHDDWITAVKYIPENKAFLSSSRSCNRQSMLYTDWMGKAEPRYYHLDKAVLCFDYNHVFNILVTGSLDCSVRVWNVFMARRPVSTLTGHRAPVTHLTMNPATKHVISVDKTRAVKVFDYLEGTVIQSFSGPSLDCMGSFAEITGFYFNMVRCQLIVATNMLGMAVKRSNPPGMAEISAHDFPVSAVCYSKILEEILTACANGVINVWDVHTGKHLLQFQHFSSRSHFQDLPWAKDNVRLEVTAMTLDSSQRCVLTGSNDGTVNVWNFSSGVLVSHYTLPDNTLITGLAVDRNSIFATGWCKQVYLLDREQKSTKEALKSFSRYHNEEVNCITFIKGGLVATGSYDGDIVVVSRDTGRPLCVLNAAESQYPISMQMRGHSIKDNQATGTTNVPQEDTSGPSHSWGGVEYVTTEDDRKMNCLRVSSRLVMVATGADAMKLMYKPLDQQAEGANKDVVFDAFQGKEVSKEVSDATFRAYESSVEALLCLQTRKNLDISTATVLSSGAEGWIRAWSLNPKGGLKGQFLATEYLGEAVKAMATNEADEFLITGDTRGYIKVWDIFPYCNAAARQLTEDDRDARRNRFISMFIYLRSPFLRDKAAEGFKSCLEYHKRQPPDASNPTVTLKTPTLLNVFRAHMQAITSVQYVNHHRIILSAGKDCSVRLWSIRGSFIGQCGAQWVKLPDPNAVKLPLRILPRDIRRNASARTFRVINTGCVPLWDHAVHCVKNYLEEKHKEKEKKAQIEAQKMEAREKGEEEEREEADSKMTRPIPLPRDDPGLPEELRLSNIVRFNWQDPKKSRILGRSFKPMLHHRHSPAPPVNIGDDFGMYPAFRQMKIIDITHMARIPTPQLVKDLENRRREEEEEAQKYRHQICRKGKVLNKVSMKSHGTKDLSQNVSVSQSESDGGIKRGSSTQPPKFPAINNSALVSCNSENGGAILDNFGGTGVVDEHGGDTDDGSQSIVLRGTTQSDRVAKSTRPAKKTVASAGTNHSDNNAVQNYVTETVENDVLMINQSDVMGDEHDVMDDDTADVDASRRDTRSDDGSRRTKSGCLFPPITLSANQKTDTKTGNNCRSGPKLSESKTPKLPPVRPTWPKTSNCSLFRGTGLSLGRRSLPPLPKKGYGEQI